MPMPLSSSETGGWWPERPPNSISGARAATAEGPLQARHAPLGTVVVQSEHGQPSPVDGTGASVDVGGDPSPAAHPSLAASPGSTDEVGDLALDLGPVAPIARLPLGGELFGPGHLEEVLVATDRDGASRA